MNRITIRVLVCILLVLDVLLLTVALNRFGPVEHTAEQLQKVEAFAQMAATEAPARPAETEETKPLETEPPETEPAETEPAQPQEERFLLSFVGDCTLGSSPNVYYAQQGFVKTVGEDYGYPFRNVHTYLQEDDFTLANLEGVLADRGSPVPKEFNFRGPVSFAGILTEGSVEAVNLANNHTQDYGKKGYASTLEALDGIGVPYVEANGTRLITLDRGLVIGLYGMTYASMELQAMETAIGELKAQGAELIIVAAHWGFEGDYRINDEQMLLGRAAIDAGAHIVYGTHPHVLQPVEEYKDGMIYYSLGNFVFGGNGGAADLDSAILRQEVIRYADGSVQLGEMTAIPVSISSVAQKNNFQPTLYEQGTEDYDRVMAKLNGAWE